MKEFPQFNCTLCGECCSGSMKVFVNPYDLYKMARFFKFKTTKELFDRKLIGFERGQHQLLLPKIIFKTEPFPFCPFLNNSFDEESGYQGLCQLHLTHKPLVCRLAPLSHTIDLENQEDEFSFILPLPDCPGEGEGDSLDIVQTKKALSLELQYETIYYQNLDQILKETPSQEERDKKVKAFFIFNVENEYPYIKF